MYVLRIIYPQKKKKQKNSTTRMFSNQFPQSAHFLESQGRMVQGYHGSQVSPRYVFHLIGNSHLWRAVPTLYSEWCPWLGTVPSKMPPNDPHILLFTSLCNPLPMNVDGICYLFLIKKKHRKGDGMSLPQLCYKWLWLLSCNRLYLLISHFACFDEVSGHLGEAESSLSQQPAENRMSLTTREWACKEVNVQASLKTLG